MSSGIISNYLWTRVAIAFLSYFFLSSAVLAADYDGSLIDAVRITLERQSSITISKQQVLAGEASVLSAQSIFDPIVKAGTNIQRTNTPLSSATQVTSPEAPFSTISSISADTTNYSVGLTKKLRSGIDVNAIASVQRITDNYLNKVASPSSSAISLNFVLPLLKGRGEEVTVSNETAALLSRDAAQQNQRHVISGAITATVAAYWDYLAAEQALDIARGAEERAQTLLADSRKLAAGDQMPRAEVKKYESRLLSESGLRIAAEQSLLQARHSLGLVMGLNRQEIARIPPPRDGFGLIDAAAIDAQKIRGMASALAGDVGSRRADIRSLDDSQRAAEALLLAANDAKKSQLDLVFGVGYNGMIESRRGVLNPAALEALGDNVHGANVSVGLSYSFPVNNLAAQGLVLQRSAQLEQIQLQRQALLDDIQSSIEVSLNSLRSAAEQLRHARLEVAIQREVYENERKKYRYGMSTALDLFSNETQLTNAQLSELNAERNLAQSLIRVRFATGTLLEPNTAAHTIDNARLVTLPELADIKKFQH